MKSKVIDFFKSIGDFPFMWLCSITLIASFFIFEDWWVNRINIIWVYPIASHIKDGASWLSIIYLFIIVIYYFCDARKSETINKNRCTVVLICTFIYVLCRYSDNWNYTLFFYNPYFACSDLVVYLSLICEIVQCVFIVCRNKSKENVLPELEIEKTHGVADTYNRHCLCESTYNTLRTSFYEESSFTLSITGTWGSGKTTFITKLKDMYDKDNTVKSVINFEPWKNDTSESIIRCFFTLLRNELRIYIPNISSTFDEYIELLLDKETERLFKTICRFFYYLSHRKSNPYDLICNKLAKTKHKTVIFIDDIDRLNVEEIKEVLRLIRNTANFPFVQFIVAYDKRYVCSALSNCGISNSDLYLEKFFNVDIALPKSENRIICEELYTRFKKTIAEIWNIKQDDLRIKNIIYYAPERPTNSIIENYLAPQILNTIRDVIRFHNSFYILAKAYKNEKNENEIEFQNLFFLELLRYRYDNVYTILANNPFGLLLLQNNIFALKEDYIETINKLFSYKKLDIDIIKNILIYLFKPNDNKINGVYNLRSYNKYFMYRLDDKILTISELLALADKKEDDAIKMAEDLYKKKYLLEFENQLNEILILFFSPNENPINKSNLIDCTKIYSLLSKIVKSNIKEIRRQASNAMIESLKIFNFADKEQLSLLLNIFNLVDFNYFGHLQSRIVNFLLRTILIKKELSNKFGHEIGDNEYHLVYNFLMNTTHPELISSGICSFIEDVNIGAIDNAKILIETSVLSDILLSYFENEQDKLSDRGFSLFYNCIEKIEPVTKYIHLRKEALKIMRGVIWDNPTKYLRKFICSGVSTNPEINTLHPESFYEDIFCGIGGFEKFLKNCDIKSEYVIRVKNFWELYKNNGYNPIRFSNQGDVKEKINNNFKTEIALLNQLKEIMKYLEVNGHLTNKLKSLLEKNTLQIELKDKIYEKLNRI